MIRTDIHRPSAIIPDDYEYVACECIKIEGIGDCHYYIMEMRRRIQDHMARTGGKYSGHEHGGNCMVCGSVNAIYTILYYHAKSNNYVRLGQDCADKIDCGGSREMSAFRAGIRSAIEAQAGKKKAQALLEERGLAAAWPIYLAPIADGYGQRNEATIRDIVSKVVKYGDLSEKAGNYIAVLLDRIARKPEIDAERAAEKAAAADCPSGRVTITGTILKIEERDSDFGLVMKMTLKAKEGFVVWMTMPSASTAQRGEEITVKATVTPSDNDPKFGFAKRPVLA